MGKLLGIADKAQYSNRKSVSLTYGSYVESSYPGSPVAIPTTEPGVSQLSITIDNSMLVTASSADIIFSQMAYIVCALNNTAGSTITCYWRVLKNGVSLFTNNSTVPSAQFTSPYTISTTCVAGDVFEVRFWASAVGLNLVYHSLQVHPWQILLASKPTYCDNVVIVTSATEITLSGANPGKVSGTSSAISGLLSTSAGTRNFFIDKAINAIITGVKFDPAVHGFYPNNVSWSTPALLRNGTYTSATYNPYYCSLSKLTSISWTPLQL